MIWYLISLTILIGSLVIIYYAIKLHNPYKLIYVMGKKGCGKSTLMAKWTQQYLKRGWTVYSSSRIAGAYMFDPRDLGKYGVYRRSVIMVDEVSLIWGDRKWKSFPDFVEEFFRYERKYAVIIILFSQTYDVDVKIRRLVDKMYLLINFFGVFVVGKQIRTKVVVVEPTENSEGRIAEGLEISPFLLTPFGARIFCWIPRWIKYFDTLEGAKVLPMKDYEFVSYPEGLPERFKPKQFRKKKGS